MHSFVQVRIHAAVRRIIFLNVVPFLVTQILATHMQVNSRDELKCTPDDTRDTFPYCMMQGDTLWCDQSKCTEVPTADEINKWLIDNDCRTARTLYINDSCLEDIGQSDLKPFAKVKVLNMEANRVTKLQSSAFSSNEDLRRIDACRNRIRDVDRNAFKGLRHLIFLNLIHNEIAEIRIGTLDHVVNLEELWLDDNFLTVLERALLRKQSKLKTLRLRSNHISTIRRHAFHGLHSLTHLHLDGNRLESVNHYTFQHLPKLEVLTLSHNGFQEWPVQYGKILVNIHTLDLGHNMISEFTSTHVVNMSKLQNLSLENNSLVSVEEELFATTPRLGYLNLGENYIDDIPERIFAGLCHLRHIILRSNRLKIPRKEWLEDLAKSKAPNHTDLNENHWECGCESKEYWDFLQSLEKHHQLRKVMDIECTWPKILKDRRLGELFRYEFDLCLSPDSALPSKPTTTISETTNQTANCTKRDFIVQPTPAPFNKKTRERPNTIVEDYFADKPVFVITIVLVIMAVVILVGCVLFRRSAKGRKNKGRSKGEHSRQDQNI